MLWRAFVSAVCSLRLLLCLRSLAKPTLKLFRNRSRYGPEKRFGLVNVSLFFWFLSPFKKNEGRSKLVQNYNIWLWASKLKNLCVCHSPPEVTKNMSVKEKCYTVVCVQMKADREAFRCKVPSENSPSRDFDSRKENSVPCQLPRMPAVSLGKRSSHEYEVAVYFYLSPAQCLRERTLIRGPGVLRDGCSFIAEANRFKLRSSIIL